MPEKTIEEPKKEEAKTNPEIDTAQLIKQLKAQLDETKLQNAELKEAKAKYYDIVLNGGSASPEPAKPKHRPISEIRKDLINSFSDNKEVTNLDYCKLVYELDEATREETGESCFLPKGHNVTPTVDEYATADKMHDLLKEAIDASDGNPISFNAELKKHIKE